MTPESDPQRKGTSDGGTGSQLGVGPCSPEGRRPSICLIPSYSKKYKAVPVVSRTETAGFNDGDSNHEPERLTQMQSETVV